MVSEENYICIDKALNELKLGGKLCALVFPFVLLEKIMAQHPSLLWV